MMILQQNRILFSENIDFVFYFFENIEKNIDISFGCRHYEQYFENIVSNFLSFEFDHWRRLPPSNPSQDTSPCDVPVSK